MIEPRPEERAKKERGDQRDDLRLRSSHFDFGANWRSYSRLVGETEVEEAVLGLSQVIPDGGLRDRAFLDIGSGSGLHSVAAFRLGASSVLAIDIDEESVETTTSLLAELEQDGTWSVQTRSVLDLDPAKDGLFGVVYSWGVLHHTGAMWPAVKRAAAMVEPRGQLAVALYRRTRLDWFWVREKRWYAKASPKAQLRARRAYVGLMKLVFGLRGKSLDDYRHSYRSSRGMDFEHDVHDWLGGYPYESVMPDEVVSFVTAQGFDVVKQPTAELKIGLLGSGCDEYVFKRSD